MASSLAVPGGVRVRGPWYRHWSVRYPP